MEKYGIIAVSGNVDAAQVKKVDHATAMRMLKNLEDIGRVGPSRVVSWLVPIFWRCL